MNKLFYEWEDKSDPYATGCPDLGYYPPLRMCSKKAVREDWHDYVATLAREGVTRKPTIRVWRISYEEVTL